MIINYDGQQYPFDMDDVTVKQALKIERYMGCSFAEWGKRLQGGEDMRARQVLGWLILHGGADVPIEDTDFKLVALGNALDAAFKAEEAADGEDSEAVPTGVALNGHSPAESSQEISRQFSAGISR